jgi:hypothetical protein
VTRGTKTTGLAALGGLKVKLGIAYFPILVLSRSPFVTIAFI